MRGLTLTLFALIAVGTAGCDQLCVFNSCGCLGSGGASYAAIGDDPAQQSASVAVGEVYSYDLRDFVYVYKAYGRDCVPDESVRYPFRVSDVEVSDASIADASASDGILEIVGTSSGATQVSVDLEATGLTDIGSASEFRVLTIDLRVTE